jgi:hypothetical protein
MRPLGKADCIRVSENKNKTNKQTKTKQNKQTNEKQNKTNKQNKVQGFQKAILARYGGIGSPQV